VENADEEVNPWPEIVPTLPDEELEAGRAWCEMLLDLIRAEQAGRRVERTLEPVRRIRFDEEV